MTIQVGSEFPGGVLSPTGLSGLLTDPTFAPDLTGGVSGAVPAPFIQRFQWAAFLEDYCTGVSNPASVVDQTAAINRALATGKILVLDKAKWYGAGLLTPVSGSGIEGHGWDGGFVRTGGASGSRQGMFNFENVDGFWCENFCVDGKRATYSGGTTNGGWFCLGGSYWVRNLRLEHIFTKECGYGLSITSDPTLLSHDIKILDCTWDDFDGAVIAVMLYCTDVHIKHNTVTRFARIASSAVAIVACRFGERIYVDDNTVTGDGAEIGTSPHLLSVDSAKEFTAHRNKFNGGNGYALEIVRCENGTAIGNTAKNMTRPAFVGSGAVSGRAVSRRIQWIGNTASNCASIGFYTFMTGADGHTLHEHITYEGNIADSCQTGFQRENIDGLVDRNNHAVRCTQDGRVDTDCINVTGGGNRISENNASRQSATITALSASGTLATATSVGHPFATGDLVLIAGATPDLYNGWVAITVTDADHFTFQNPLTGLAAASGTITAKRITRYITSLTLSGSTATATCANHGFSTSDVVTIYGATPAEYNGPKTITVVDANTFTYPTTSGIVTPASGTLRCVKAASASFAGSRRLWTNLGADKDKVRMDGDFVYLNGTRDIYDISVNAFRGFINDMLFLPEVNAAPRVENLTLGSPANVLDRLGIFAKGNKLIIAYNNAGTITYGILDPAAATFTNSTTLPS